MQMEKKNVKMHIEVMLVFVVLLCFGRNVQAFVKSEDDCCLECKQLCKSRPDWCYDNCRRNCPPDYCSGAYT